MPAPTAGSSSSAACERARALAAVYRMRHRAFWGDALPVPEMRRGFIRRIGLPCILHLFWPSCDRLNLCNRAWFGVFEHVTPGIIKPIRLDFQPSLN